MSVKHQYIHGIASSMKRQLIHDIARHMELKKFLVHASWKLVLASLVPIFVLSPLVSWLGAMVGFLIGIAFIGVLCQEYLQVATIYMYHHIIRMKPHELDQWIERLELKYGTDVPLTDDRIKRILEMPHDAVMHLLGYTMVPPPETL